MLSQLRDALSNEHKIIQRLVFRLAKKYIAGYTLSSVLQEVRTNSTKGIKTTVTFLNEGAVDAVRAKYNANTYVQFVKQASRLHLSANVSVRLSQIGIRLNDGVLDKCMGDILLASNASSGMVWIEAENGIQMEELFEQYRRFRQKNAEVGMEIPIWYPLEVQTIKRYLKRGDTVKLTSYSYTERKAAAAEEVAEEGTYRHLMSKVGRKEKGSKPPKIKNMLQYYVSDIGKLLQAGVSVAVLDHDEELVARLAGFSKEYKKNLIFELPLGYSKGWLNKLVKMKVNLGIYTPYGKDLAPYIINKLTVTHGKIRTIATKVLDGNLEGFYDEE